ncbi:hypothetical protein ILUMI_13076 [Ignelater luminosus]|uniref:Mos1 transposase HTH domain-containing protein n=1 Tax=Ignelater luminosus TaxID=2038154 RepID=A0A8K0CWW7_IGNLU|nr:hypothetical protein ILUMI_13076 [Ignelater luminosus]
MSFHNFKVDLSEEECVLWLHSAFGNEAPSRVTVFRWYRESRRECNSLRDREHMQRPRSAVTTENMDHVRKMTTNDNRCTYQAKEADLSTRSGTVNRIVHEV